MPANYVLLERIELNASAASVTFSNIPQSGYTDLKVVSSTREADQNFFVAQFNGDTTTSNYSSRFIRGNGATVASASSSSVLRIGVSPLTGSASTVFSSNECYIPNYTGSQQKSVSVDFADENNGTGDYIGFNAGLWAGTAAISSIKIFSETAQSFVAGSTFSLYGLAAVGTTPAIAPQASGGNIQTDGTYWYHTFLASGTFTPGKALTCDVLQVAGGGSGGNNASGGGGAGGLLYSTSKSFANSISHTVTIGAGGANQTSYSSNGYNGTNSTISGSGFTTLTAVGGGSGQGPTSTPAGNGGSGGGAAGYSGSPAAGTGTSGQGNNGGTNAVAAESSGGGGAGGVGGNGGNNSARTGVGGVGLYYDAFGSATSTGQYVSSHYYYAGGGGGGAGTGSTAGTAGGYGGGGTGAGSDQTTLATAGTANTGGGGGGTGYGNTSASSNTGGGSGIVIIRYTIA